MTYKSDFDRRLDLAVKLLSEIRAMEDKPKLTAKAFLRDAMKAAQCDAARLDELAKIVQQPEASRVRAFVNTLAHEIREPNIARCPTDYGKVSRAWGSEEAMAELAIVKSTVAECWALAVRQVAEHWPEAFGQVDNWEKHQADIAEARRRLDGMLAKLRTGYAPNDLIHDTATLTPEERSRGLSRISFKRCPSVTPANPNWPLALVQNVLSPPAAPVLAQGRVDDVGVGEDSDRRAGRRVPIINAAA